ncbi:hydroxymethylbilane synthase SCDLUD_002035 [Saccharomycodes ludwigii]|uniref:hydroxymethylbilane synthase n=1 Tax=Saccharomycodes ludwigii TaxID=36035 RepID=UPI001E88B5D1|nr:hypothetical protein SCDLUD_002035 [Saccharomycodes ludwigii]KAH3902219.1 hypothetical protein SCDLUD_002035 [Saccharomycodes ludwigii]
MTSEKEVHIGGRRSKLAVVQSEHVKSLIQQKLPNIKTLVLALQTYGDTIQTKPLYSFGGKALWTAELEDKLACNELDLIVHSLKDMPTNLPELFELGGITKREDPSDCVVMKLNSPYKTLDDLPNGSVVGTSSIRRTAQLRRKYPKLIFKSVRGNIQTRLNKLDNGCIEDDVVQNYECIILATAGLVRLKLESRITCILEAPLMYHAVGQGALGIEIRKNDARMKKILNEICDKNATICCLAERSLMKTLEGGCSVPLGVSTNYDGQVLKIAGCVVSCDGKEYVEAFHECRINCDEDYAPKCKDCGEKLAKKLVAGGAKAILDEINYEKIK